MEKIIEKIKQATKGNIMIKSVLSFLPKKKIPDTIKGLSDAALMENKILVCYPVPGDIVLMTVDKDKFDSEINEDTLITSDHILLSKLLNEII